MRIATAFHHPLIILAACLLSSVVGCGGDDGEQLVTGSVAYRGEVVTRGIINFIGADNVPRGGPINVDGTYECRLPSGDYKVIITAPALPKGEWKDGDPPPEGPPEVPLKYGQPHTSGLTARVGDQEKTVDFSLE